MTNKIMVKGESLIDLTQDSLTTAEQVAEGVVALSKSGNLLTGTMIKNVSTQFIKADSSTSGVIRSGNFYVVKSGNLMCAFPDKNCQFNKQKTGQNSSNYKICQLPASWDFTAIGFDCSTYLSGQWWIATPNNDDGTHYLALYHNSSESYADAGMWIFGFDDNYSNDVGINDGGNGIPDDNFWAITKSSADSFLNDNITKDGGSLIEAYRFGNLIYLCGRIIFANDMNRSNQTIQVCDIAEEYRPPVDVQTTCVRTYSAEPYSNLHISSTGRMTFDCRAKVTKTSGSGLFARTTTVDDGTQANVQYNFSTFYMHDLGTEYSGDYS